MDFRFRWKSGLAADIPSMTEFEPTSDIGQIEIPQRSSACYPFGRKHGRDRALNRRLIISLLGGAATWPLAARARQPAVPVVGLLSGIDPDDRQLAAFRQGLNEVGYIAGKSVTIEHRSAAGQYDRLPALANDLVRRQVTVL